MNPRHWFFDRVLSERQIVVLLVAIGAVIFLQSWAWDLNTWDVISPDKGNEIHYLVFIGQSIRVRSVAALFPYFVGGQVLLVLLAVIFRSRVGLTMAIVLPLLWVCLVVERSN